MARYYMSVHVMTDDAEYWHLHLQAFTRHLKTKKKRVHKQLQMTCKKRRVNNVYFPGPLTCNFSLTCVFTREESPTLCFTRRILQAKFTYRILLFSRRRILRVNFACKILK